MNNYSLLSRLISDCEYYLNQGNRNNKYLWALNPQDQIDEMISLWESLDPKPEWTSLEVIMEYKKLMIG